jgi:transcriptional regulator with XRE-family HTH domain
MTDNGVSLMNAEWFGGRLKELREQVGLTQPELAERSGLSKDGIAQLEQGRRRPAWDTVLALSAALGVDCTAFTEPPAAREPTRPGRPAKVEAEKKPKRPRGRKPKQ